MYFYSKSTGGFYTDVSHGAKLISVQDPSWVRPEIEVEDPDDPQKKLTIPDTSAQPAMIEVENADSLIPSDAVAVTDDEHADLFEQQSKGMEIVAGPDGKPVAQAPVATVDGIRIERDAKLTATDGLVRRHMDEREMGDPTTLTDDQFKALMTYRKALRDLPKQSGFPESVTWPVEPQ